MKERIILQTVSRFLIPFILVYSIYIQMHGEYSPGGGFQAGVIAAAAFILYALIYSMESTKHVLPVNIVLKLCCIGPLIYATVGIVTMLKGANFLSYGILLADPVKGQKIGIILIELGVGITVFAVMMIIFYLFAGRLKNES